MTDKIQNNIKDNYTISINNFSSDNIKNHIPISNINTNLNSNLNSFSQENFFNEMLNSTNCQESKNNSSIYNFSESIHSNQDNFIPSLIMNKDQLYQTFLLFQQFLRQNLNNNILNYISQNKNGNKIENKLNNKSNDKDKNNSINKINEINELDYNEVKNEELYNSNNISIKEKTNQILNNQNNQNNKNQKELLKNKNLNKILNDNHISNNGKRDNMIFLEESENKDIYSSIKENDNSNIKIIKKRNKTDINNNITKTSYDEIPIKFNKENFVDLVEKKLADEKKYENKTQENNDQKKFEHIHKIKQKKDNEKINQIQHNSSNTKKNKNKTKNDKNKIKINEKKENIIDKDKNESNLELDEEKLKNEKNNNLNNNYSFDKEDTKVLNENKNIFESSSIIDNLNINNIIIKSNLKKESAKIKNENINNKNTNNDDNNDNIIISRNNLNKLFLSNSKEIQIKNYKIEKFEICLLSDIISNRNKKNELENENNKIEEKEELLNQKIKEINKEMVKLKEDRNKVNKLKIEYEKSMSKLNNELYQFTQKKEEFENFRKNELNKFKNDKKNLLAETKNIKDIKSQNQALVLKTKKDKEIIDNLKSKISELQSIIKQKENNSIGINYSSNTFKYNQKRNKFNRNNIIEELEFEDINSNPNIQGYNGNFQKSSIRSITNINNIFNNTIEDKIKNRIICINKDKDLDNISMTLKRNNSSNKNYIISKKIEVMKNKDINRNNLTASNLVFYNDNKISNSKSKNKSGEYFSLSKKNISEKLQKDLLGNKVIINNKNIFSPQPQACRTTIGFGLKKLTIKLNNTPKDNVKLSKKVFENKSNENNKKQSYSKTTTTNNLSGSINNNINYDSNQNSYSNTNNNFSNNYKINIYNKKLTKDNKQLKKQSCNELKNKIKKVITSKTSKNDIFISKNKNNSINQHFKVNKKIEDYNLNNSINNKMILFNNKTLTKENISRNLKSNKKEKINITDNNTNNMINYSTFVNKDINKTSDEYDFKIPEKYLNKEYKLLKTLNADDKIINLYTNEKKEIIFKSGVKKEIYEDGHQIIYFVNGDLKQIFPTGKSCYYFSETKTVQITLNNGIEIYKFENGQIEKHYPDGSKRILFNDGTERYINSEGFEETYYYIENVPKVDKNKNVITEKLIDVDKE